MSRPDDASFERALLDSATLDGPPHSGAEAWASFCANLAQLEGSTRDAAPQPSAPGRRDGVVFVQRASLVVLGALGGGLITALALGWSGGQPLVSRRAPRRSPAHELSAAPAPVFVPEPHLQPSAAGSAAAKPPEAHANVRSRRPSTRARAHRPSEDVPPERSTLAAEVAAIEAARDAARAGMYPRTLRLVAQYHGRFPSGELAPDADVVAIEAAASMHDAEQVTQRARDFLARYPNDPHAARVQTMWTASNRSER